MTRALVFPGQGSQSIGMGKALYATFAEARDVFEEVDSALNQKLSTMIFEGSPEDLNLTENTQPALMAVSMAVIRVLDKQGSFRLPEAAQFVAGHSLGEYCALCAAGALTLSDTAKLLRKRGKAMQEAVPVGQGTMAALLGGELHAARECAAQASQNGEICEMANDNSPGQIVISGHVAAVDRAIELATQRGFKRGIKLPVSAPFHSSLMQPAAAAMHKELFDVRVKEPVVPVVANVTAQPATNPNILRDLLVKQITSAVRWRESVLYMKEQGVTEFVECGAGSVLTNMAKRIDKDFALASLNTPESIETFLKGL